MYTIRSYQFAQSMDEAYQLLQRDKKNAVLGGCGWLKMGHKKIHTAIDLSRLGLNTIKAEQGKIYIGATASLRQLQTSPLLQTRFGGILPQCVQGIVGVQFRNTATVGASVFSRYGFSDVVTALLALNASVELYNGGVIPLEEYLTLPVQRDILVQVILEDNGCTAAYQSMRNTTTDFPVLAVAVSRLGNSWRVAVGARPGRAVLACRAAELLANGAQAAQAGEAAAAELAFGTNLRAGASYRRALAQVLVKRAAAQCMEGANI